MPYRFSRGAVFYADFPFEEDLSKSKIRTVLVWEPHTDGTMVLASKITGVIRSIRWEVLLNPGTHNGLKKQCVIRVDQTKYLPISAFSLPALGSLNPFEILEAELRLKEYIAYRKGES